MPLTRLPPAGYRTRRPREVGRVLLNAEPLRAEADAFVLNTIEYQLRFDGTSDALSAIRADVAAVAAH